MTRGEEQRHTKYVVLMIGGVNTQHTIETESGNMFSNRNIVCLMMEYGTVENRTLGGLFHWNGFQSPDQTLEYLICIS